MLVTARLAQLGFRQPLGAADEVEQHDVADRNLALVAGADVDVDLIVVVAVEEAGDPFPVAEEGGDLLIGGRDGGEPQRGGERGRDGDALRQAESR